MRAYEFVRDSNDKQRTTFHETGTGEFRTLRYITHHFSPIHPLQTSIGCGEVRRCRSWFASFPTSSRNDQLTTPREAVSSSSAREYSVAVRLSHLRLAYASWGGKLRPSVMDLPGPTCLYYRCIVTGCTYKIAQQRTRNCRGVLPCFS